MAFLQTKIQAAGQNTNSNKAENITDRSVKGANLQLKADLINQVQSSKKDKKDTMQRKAGIPVQRMAWIISRDLNLGLSGSSNSGGSSSRVDGGSSHGSMDSSHGAVSSGATLSLPIESSAGSNSSTESSSHAGSKETTSGKALNGPQNNETKGRDAIIDKQPHKLEDLEKVTKSSSWLKKFGNLKFHHRHILFDKKYNLPYTTGDADGDNIGYGGTLYYESDVSAYQKNDQITNTHDDDKELIEAIKRNTPDKFGAYNLLSNNCQHWVNTV
ncbi:MAG: hypothetical protein M0P13_06285, partial [Fibrobacteraceae bacterium]|nr:hypothetical protein [Fibrobacteraceae bacterium]